MRTDNTHLTISSQFRKLSIQERLDTIQELLISQYPNIDTLPLAHELLQGDKHSLDIADMMIESAVGSISVPLGIVSGLVVDSTPTLVPLATEEPSVIAAANYAAKIFARGSDGIHTRIHPPLQIVQIALSDVDADGEQLLTQAIPELHTNLMEHLESMHKRGGGMRKIALRRLVSGLLIVHITIDVQDAMGANIVNTAAEYIAPKIAEISKGVLLSSIVSNFSEERLVHAHVILDINAIPVSSHSRLSTTTQIANHIELMSVWAEEDIYRATTHNKGIMNGVTGLALATGNDTRALEASSHALASTMSTLISSPYCKNRIFHMKEPYNKPIATNYHPLSVWRVDDEHATLEGTVTLPSVLASVGGSTQHPIALWSRYVLGLHNDTKVLHAHTLNRVAAALALTQNFAALLALVTSGIQHGHMSLHSRKQQ